MTREMTHTLVARGERIRFRPRTCRLAKLGLLAIGVVGLLAPSVTRAQDATPTAVPEPRTEYLGRTIAQTMHWTGAEWLVRDSREREERGSLMLSNLGVEPGMTICDLGCGNGFHTLKLARMVGSKGKVYAVDIQPEMLTLLSERAKRTKLTNIVPVLGLLHDPEIPEATMDLVLMVDVYHELSYPEQVLAAIKKSLAPGGKLVLVEFRAEDPRVPIKPLHKMSKDQIDKEMMANGFRLASSFDRLPWQHLVFYEVADEPDATKPPSEKPAPDRAAPDRATRAQAAAPSENPQPASAADSPTP